MRDSPSSVMRVRETSILSKEMSRWTGGKSIRETPVLTLTKAQGQWPFCCLFKFIAVTPEIPCQSPARVFLVPGVLLKMFFPLYSCAWTEIRTLLFWPTNEGFVLKVIGYLWSMLFLFNLVYFVIQLNQFCVESLIILWAIERQILLHGNRGTYTESVGSWSWPTIRWKCKLENQGLKERLTQWITNGWGWLYCSFLPKQFKNWDFNSDGYFTKIHRYTTGNTWL